MLNQKFYVQKRKELLEAMGNRSAAIINSGKEKTASMDLDFPFEVNRNFHYLTGLSAPNMNLLIYKAFGAIKSILFIPRTDETQEKWFGRMVKVEQAKAISGVEDVMFIDEYEEYMYDLINRSSIDTIYMLADPVKKGENKSYETHMYNDYHARYPFIAIKDLAALLYPMRGVKTAEEIEEIKAAGQITKQAMERIMQNLYPGMNECEVQADFEYVVRKNNMGLAFNTIVAAGDNGPILHSATNCEPIEDGELVLIDAGARKGWYNSDVTRTFPVNGKFTQRQKQLYEIVLLANKKVIAAAKAGVYLGDLNNIVIETYQEELKKIGLINSPEEVSKYYYHGVSHSLGLDTHDVVYGKKPLTAGYVITVEPGIYIAEENIGIRIEDDILIKKDGCEVLTKDIIKEVADIEAYMAQ